jgi:aromatic-L-amino-acid/L-tryptophan decarboxylase
MKSSDEAIGLATEEFVSRNSALFPTGAQREQWDNLLTRSLAQAKRHIAENPVIPGLDRAAILEQLANFDFSAPVPVAELLQWTVARLERGLVQVTHPRYFGLFNPMPTFPAQCADRIAGAFNPQLATAATSPFAVEVEAHVIRAVARRAGLPPETTGHFTTGGSEANYTALILALTRAGEGFGSHGARAFEGPPVFYVSQDSHLAWLKIAHQAGIGRSAVCLIATDGFGRLDPNSLADAMRADRGSGRIPVMIVATAGTTNAGMIDPLAACGAIAREARIWYHVDAAWGGALITSDKLIGLLAGLEQADSVTIDAHKWLATTMCCGMFLTRWPAALSAAFQVVTTSYMPSNVPGLDPYVTTAQWSRRFLGLRLFLSLAAAGWRGYAEHVERAVALIKLLEHTLAKRGWVVTNNALLAVLCVRPPPGAANVRSIVQRIVASGRAWVAVSMFQGSEVVRICLTNAETEVEDIMALASDLEAASMS